MNLNENDAIAEKQSEIVNPQLSPLNCVDNSIPYEGMAKKEIYYNFRKNYNYDITSWNSPRNYAEVITLELPQNIKVKDLKSIDFLDSMKVKTSWVNSDYYGENIQDIVKDKLFKNYASNIKTYDYVKLKRGSKFDFWMIDKKTEEGAILISKQCVFFNWFSEQDKDLFKLFTRNLLKNEDYHQAEVCESGLDRKCV